jgi:hypothetical protein
LVTKIIDFHYDAKQAKYVIRIYDSDMVI